jgi:hypothetical protein
MTDHSLYCREHVSLPYALVRDLLIADPYRLFERAIAGVHPRSATQDRERWAGLGNEVNLEIVGITMEDASPRPVTKIALEWRDSRSARLFPALRADLVVFGVSATRTDLELRASYRPPSGRLGDAIDEATEYLLLHASLTRFLQQVTGWLRGQQTRPGTPPFDQAEAPHASAVDLE